MRDAAIRDAATASDAGHGSDGSARDGAQTEAGAEHDSGAHPPADAAIDAGLEAGADASLDGSRDAGADANARDAAQDAGDARVPRCGDGIVDVGESCDDGNSVDGDGCDDNCTATGCGNGIITAGEACDDHNRDPDDGCSASCQLECGDGAIEGQEQCDGSALGGASCASRGFASGALGCTASCDFDTSQCVASVCGNHTVETGESCDDGNTNAGDGCSAICKLEPNEVEPNDDGTPDVGASAIDGNDFDAVAVSNANMYDAFHVNDGPVNIHAALNPAGDEDVFAFTNDSGSAIDLRVDTWNMGSGFGFGVPCGQSIDTGIDVRDASGTLLASDDDRDGDNDLCSGLFYTLTPGQTVYVQVVSYADQDVIAAYVLEARYRPIACGDGRHSRTEECDDGNLQNGDGCSMSCTLEGVSSEVEPNDTPANATASPLQIAGSTTIRGSIASAGDADLYRVTVSTATVVRFETFTSLLPSECTVDTMLTLRLLDANGNAIISDVDGAGIGECGAIVFFLNAGTYFIRVEQTGNAAAVPSYFLQVAYQTDRGAESEPAAMSGTNDTRATASANLNPGSDVFVFGDHTLLTDSDYYAITVPAGAAVRAEVIEGNRTAKTCESNAVDSRLTLYDASGTMLADDDDNGRGFCSLIDGTGSEPVDADAHNTGASAATFYLQVRRSASGTVAESSFSYRLQVTLRN